MKISAIPHLYRNIRRWTEILSVLSKHGLADWISRLNIDFFKGKTGSGEPSSSSHSSTQRARLALTDLGPTFIKFGQILSTRPDLIGIELAMELKKLQNEVRPEAFSSIKKTVEQQLGQKIEDSFQEFEETPIASASIGQVHVARLNDGQQVAVKVQRSNIESKIHQDLEVLAGLAHLAERIPEFAAYRPTALVAELSRVMRRELDFGREERNLVQFAANFDADNSVEIPVPFTDYCTSRVLTMSFLRGVSLDDTDQIQLLEIDRDEVARRGAELYMEMIFSHGFYHADPHPGNFLLISGNVIGLLDFGMVGRIDEYLRESIEEMLMAIVNQDVPMLTTLIKRVGQVPTDLDEGALGGDVAEFVQIFATQSLGEFDLAGALTEMTEIIRRYDIVLPTQAAMLLKVLITLEGTTRMLNPRFCLMEVMEPFHRKMLLRRFSPRRQLRKFRRIYMEMERLAEVLPSRLLDIFEQVQEGRFDVHLDHRGLGPSINRLVLGMLASALFLGSALMLSRQVPPLLFTETPVWGMKDLSLLGLTGCVVSLLVGLRLLWAIGRSGHLDRRE